MPDLVGMEMIAVALFAAVVIMSVYVSNLLARLGNKRAGGEEIPPSPGAPTVLAEARKKEKAKDILSSDEMVISGEIDLLDEEDVTQLETQPIPTESDEEETAEPKSGSYPPGNMKTASPEDFNLKELVKNLRTRMLTPLDYEFPEKVTIADHVGATMIDVHLVGQRTPENDIDLCSESGLMEVMRWKPDCRRVDCHLFVRPFIRVLTPKSDWAIDHLRSMRGTVEIDGEAVAEDVPIDSWIVNLADHGLTALPYKFIPMRGYSLWGYSYKGKTPEPTAFPAQRVYPDPAELGPALAPVLTDESEVVVKLRRADAAGLRIIVGLVTGLYSTVPR